MKEERLRILLAGGLNGDASAYRSFLMELTTDLRTFLLRRLARRPAEVEDIVQELLIAIHNKRHTYDPAQPLTAWIHAIARYKLIDYLRRHGRTDALHDPLEPDATIHGIADGEAAEARYDIAKLLKLLPDRQRLPILFVKIEGATVADTAKRIGMSESAVKIGIHRGLKALIAALRSVR